MDLDDVRLYATFTHGGNLVRSTATLIGYVFAACHLSINFQADFAPSDPSWVWFPVSSNIVNLGELWQPSSRTLRGDNRNFWNQFHPDRWCSFIELVLDAPKEETWMVFGTIGTCDPRLPSDSAAKIREPVVSRVSTKCLYIPCSNLYNTAYLIEQTWKAHSFFILFR